MKRLFAVLSLLALLGGLLTGCADTADDGGVGTDNPRVTSNVTSSPAPMNTLPGAGSGANGNASGNGGNGSGTGTGTGSGSSDGEGAGLGTGADSGL